MGQRGESVTQPSPQGHPFQCRPLSSTPHPRLTITSLFQQKGGEREGESQGCAWLLLALIPSAGPFPSRQETSPGSQPAAGLSPTPLPRDRGVTLNPAAGLALRLRPDSSAMAPKAWHNLARLRSTGPTPGPQLRPPAPRRWLRAGSLGLSCWGGRMTKALLSLLTQRKPGTAGQGCEKSLCSGQPRGKGQKPGLESQAGGGCAVGRTTAVNPSQAGEG